jgi:hypothetical protein
MRALGWGDPPQLLGSLAWVRPSASLNAGTECSAYTPADANTIHPIALCAFVGSMRPA